jgi:3-isopropylmalate/(R)-2-methylmalate dehydratase small subunit
MKEPRLPNGYGAFLLHDFYRDKLELTSQIIVAKRNFGCGSSREAAVYALIDYGIKCVIAPSFGDIFANNATKNGLLLITLEEDAIEALPNNLHIDLQHQKINGEVNFNINANAKKQLLTGMDDIDQTMVLMPEIDKFLESYR